MLQLFDHKCKLTLQALLAASVLTLAACGGGSSDPEPPVASNDSDSDGIVSSDDNCPATANPNQEDSDVDGAGDACDSLPTSYVFTDADGADTVSYTGQTIRHIFVEDLVDTIESLTEGGVSTGGSLDPNVARSLNFYFRFSEGDNETSLFALPQQDLLPNEGGELTYGSISSGKDLVGKIAGGDGAGAGETSRLIGNEFFGWSQGLSDNALPVNLVDYYFAQLESLATDNVTPSIPTTAGDVPLNTVYVSATGVDYRQLVQKFLSGAVAFSQGTNDYFQTDFANALELEGDNAYTAAEHDWDEAFGYFGAARDYASYTDDEIKDPGYKDTNNDNLIDIRSEYNFGHSSNCAKRDLGSAGNSNPTDFTKEVFDAFLLGREILKNAAAAGELSSAAQTSLNEQAEIAAVTWEKCIAATVVHYINDVREDMEDFDNGVFASEENFTDLAKHWGEMKGFALALQFSPYSPFRDDANALTMLKTILSDMGDAPVLADGTQAGQPYEGGVAAYRSKLLELRDMFEVTYGFDVENVEKW